MSKKVLVLSGSPRKAGNSDLLCDQFIKGSAESGHQVEKIFLRDKEINYCIACYKCKNTNGKCTFDDDMAEILEKMIEADVIVMATPVYFYSINAQLKTLIDRTVARYTEIRDTEFYFMMTAAVESRQKLDSTLECLRGFIDCLSVAKEKEVIYGTGAWKKGEIKGTAAMDQAYQAGKNL